MKKKKFQARMSWRSCIRLTLQRRAKGVNILVDEGILYKKRGIGMFVSKGAKDMILNKRKGAFYENYVKSLIEEAKSIGITTKELIKMIEESES